MAKGKSIQERLVAKYKKTPLYLSRFDKDLEVTPEEAEWIKEHEQEFIRLIDEAQSKCKRFPKYHCNNVHVVDGEVQLVMGW